jgi:putative transposase
MEVIKTAHSMYCLQYHVVWVYKYRRKILKAGVCSYIRKTLLGLFREMPRETIRNYVEHQGQQDSGQLRQKL